MHKPTVTIPINIAVYLLTRVIFPVETKQYLFSLSLSAPFTCPGSADDVCTEADDGDEICTTTV